MRKLFILIFVLLFSVPAFAEDLYYAQSQAGTHSGDSCANAIALSAISWGSGTGNIGASDTAHLCGTLTSTLTVGASGTSGNLITIKFETGAKFSKAYWGTDTSAAINAAGRNYITIDGGTNGIIENTDNGDSFGNQQITQAIEITSGTHYEIKNLTIQNLYVHVANVESTVRGRCINAVDSSYVSVHNNTLNNAYFAFVGGTTGSSNLTNIDIYSNTISACSTDIVVGLGGGSIDTVNIYNNTITMGANWYEAANGNHVDGIHIWGLAGTAYAVSNVQIYNNNIGGDCGGHSTSTIFLEYYVPNPLIYNNVLWSVTHYPGDGYIFLKGTGSSTSGARIYNNTINGMGSGPGVEITGHTGVIFENNIITNVPGFILLDDGTSNMTTSNYNDFYPSSGNVFTVGGTTHTLSYWQNTLGYDANSISTNPNLNSDYSEKSNSPTVDAGTSISSVFTTDYLGYTRSGTWDIGAYEYGAGGVVNGACGSADGGTFSSTPTTNLCTTGTTTEVTLESTTYSWDCEGSGGGTTDNCTATYEAPADTTAPAVTISTASGSTITSDNKTVAGTATDAVGVSGCKYRIGSDTIDATHGTACTGTTSWSCATSGYASGSNTVYVECYDAVPNYSTGHSITVTYNPPASTALLSGAVCKGCVVK